MNDVVGVPHAQIATAPPPIPRHIGVLFVHGIGSAKRGETLLEWGEAIKRELAVSGWKVDNIEVAEGKTLSSFRLASPAGRRLTFTEAWWADAFPQPSFLQFLKWSVVAVPWTVVSHCDDRFRRRGDDLERAIKLRGWRSLAALLYLVDLALEAVWLFIGLLVVPAVLWVSALSVILAMIPALRGVAVFFQRLVTATVGDSFVFADRELIRLSICDAVERALVALYRRCDRVVVVAHSQGAAVSHEVLKAHARRSGMITAFVSFGSGLRKLTELRGLAGGPAASCKSIWLAWGSVGFAVGAAYLMLRELPLPAGPISVAILAPWVLGRVVLPFALCFLGLGVRTLLQWIWMGWVRKKGGDRAKEEKRARAIGPSRFFNLAGLCVIAVAAIVLAAIGLWGDWVSTGIAVGLGTAFTLLMEWRYSARPSTNREEHRELEEATWKDTWHLGDVLWWDAYAGADPVSNGPLMDEHRPPLYFPDRIANEASLALDHITYWGNRKQFVKPLAELLERLAEGQAPQNSKSADSSAFSSTPLEIVMRLVVLLPLVLAAVTAGSCAAYLNEESFSVRVAELVDSVLPPLAGAFDVLAACDARGVYLEFAEPVRVLLPIIAAIVLYLLSSWACRWLVRSMHRQRKAMAAVDFLGSTPAAKGSTMPPEPRAMAPETESA